MPPSPTLRPWRRTSDKVNVALATATLISAVDTNPTPPPNAVPTDTACHKREAHPRKGTTIPWIRAIVGIGSLLSLDSMFPSSTLNTQHTQSTHTTTAFSTRPLGAHVPRPQGSGHEYTGRSASSK